MSNEYFIEQANFVLREAVNKYDLGNRGYTDKVELGHLYAALKKENLLAEHVTKIRFIEVAEDLSDVKVDWCDDNAVSDDDIEALSIELDNEKFLVEE
jgi:hypothetical protein